MINISRGWSSGHTHILTLGVQNIKNTFLILSCSSSRHGLYKVLKAFHRDAGPCWLQCFSQLCQVGWMSFGWWTVVDTHKKLLCKKPSSVAVLDTLKPVRMAPTTILHSKALKYFVLPIHPLNGTHSQLPQGLNILLYPIFCPSSTVIEVDLTSDINKGS